MRNDITIKKVGQKTKEQKTNGPVAHLILFLPSTQGKVILRQTVLYGHIFNLPEIFKSTNLIKFKYKKWSLYAWEKIKYGQLNTQFK